MKKVLFGLLIMLSLSMSSQNSFDKTVDKTSNGVETVYEDGKDAVTTVYSDLKTIAPKISDGVKEIAKGLKVGAESVWDILVKQQLVWSICFLILTLSALLNWFIFYKRNLNKLTEKDFIIGKKPVFGEILNDKYDKYYAKYDDDIRGKMYVQSDKPTGEEDTLLYITNPNNIWFKYLHLIICIGLSLLSIYHFADMLTGFINPEFGAIKTIATIAQNIK